MTNNERVVSDRPTGDLLSYEVVGRTNYKGDVREGVPKVSYSDEHGLVYPISAEYDEDADRTTVEWGKKEGP